MKKANEKFLGIDLEVNYYVPTFNSIKEKNKNSLIFWKQLLMILIIKIII